MIRTQSDERQSATDDEHLADLVEEITQKIEDGESIDPREYQQRFPQLAERLAQLIPAMRLLESIGLSGSKSAESKRPALDDLRENQRQLGDFLLIREIGRGGMGVVFLANQKTLHRPVARKVHPFAAGL